jgi:hypothetical protein
MHARKPEADAASNRSPLGARPEGFGDNHRSGVLQILQRDLYLAYKSTGFRGFVVNFDGEARRRHAAVIIIL